MICIEGNAILLRFVRNSIRYFCEMYENVENYQNFEHMTFFDQIIKVYRFNQNFEESNENSKGAIIVLRKKSSFRGQMGFLKHEKFLEKNKNIKTTKRISMKNFI